MQNMESVAQKMAELLNFETSKFGNIAAVAVVVVVRVTTEVALDPGNQYPFCTKLTSKFFIFNQKI